MEVDKGGDPSSRLEGTKTILSTSKLDIDISYDLSMWCVGVAFDRFLSKEYNVAIIVLCFSIEFSINPYKYD